MFRWVCRLFFPCLALLAGVGMFVLKYQVIAKEDELESLHRQIWNDSREIHLLEADWAMANDPMRLRTFVTTQTDFKPFQATQLVPLDTIPLRLPPTPGIKPDFDPPEETP